MEWYSIKTLSTQKDEPEQIPEKCSRVLAALYRNGESCKKPALYVNTATGEKLCGVHFAMERKKLNPAEKKEKPKPPPVPVLRRPELDEMRARLEELKARHAKATAAAEIAAHKVQMIVQEMELVQLEISYHS